MKNIIRAILVDDVELMRITLRKVLEQFPNIDLIGEAIDFDSAKELINSTKPDLVFLDIDLNGLTSIDLLNQVNHVPKIIFITSHPDFAIKAFELNAVDYILKPVSTDRIRKAIERLTNDAVSAKQSDSETSALTDGGERFEAEQIILLSFDNKMNFIRIKDINYIEAFGNYTKIFMNDGKLSITYNSIKNWDNKLPQDTFIQIHRSSIVNLINVVRIEKWTNDTGRLYLKGIEKPFEISRSYFFQIKKKYKI
ncbi:MAG: LytTR family DNA-binding domain-containing protein [Bacteroidetes bacterium]|nr:LytTR family DNA-binding domain-containing protein [Bacteroidota bacterium]